MRLLAGTAQQVHLCIYRQHRQIMLHMPLQRHTGHIRLPHMIMASMPWHRTCNTLLVHLTLVRRRVLTPQKATQHKRL